MPVYSILSAGSTYEQDQNLYLGIKMIKFGLRGVLCALFVFVIYLVQLEVRHLDSIKAPRLNDGKWVDTTARIAMITIAAGDEYKKKVELGTENKRAYCQEQGYDFIFSDESQDSSRHIYWSKILLVLKTLENPAYKWVVWVDADTLVMNQGIRLEDIIDEKYNFIISKDFNGINSGVFFIKNCAWARLFLQSVYARTDCISADWPEQRAIALQLETSTFSALAKVVPQRVFNSYAEELFQGSTISYQPGDFILHFAGANNGLPGDGLISLFQNYAQKVIPHPARNSGI